jgi:hypothetical protein
LFTHKRHSSLTTGVTNPLMLGFIQEMLPEIEEAYRVERSQVLDSMIKSQANGTGTSAAGTDEAEMFVSEEELTQLESDYKRMKDECIQNLAEDFLRKHLIVFRHDEKDLLMKIAAQPLMQDGASKIYIWNAGTESTKDPPSYLSPHRMKAASISIIVIVVITIIIIVAYK